MAKTYTLKWQEVVDCSAVLSEEELAEYLADNCKTVDQVLSENSTGDKLWTIIDTGLISDDKISRGIYEETFTSLDENEEVE